MDQHVLQALANPTRIRILKSLEEGSKTYTDLMRGLGLDLDRDRGKFTYHLNLLKQTSLIEEEDGLYQLTDRGRTSLVASEMPGPAETGIPPGAESDISTASGLALAAMLVAAILGLFGLSILSFFIVPVRFFFPTIWIGAAMAVAFPILIYFAVYRRLKEARVEEVLTPALVLGILTLVLAGVIPGILLFIAYVKAKDALAKIQAAGEPQA